MCMQVMSSERVALMVRHEAVLGRLEEALQENSALQAQLLEQANQVGALGAAQEALGQQLEAQQQLQGLQGSSLQSQVCMRRLHATADRVLTCWIRHWLD